LAAASLRRAAEIVGRCMTGANLVVDGGFAVIAT